jgi:cell division protein FtsZ
VEVQAESSCLNLTNETREIKVNQPVQFVPVTEFSDNGIIKYS